MELQCIAELEYGPVWDVFKVTFLQLLNCARGCRKYRSQLCPVSAHTGSLYGTPVMRLWCFSVSNILERYCNGSENLAV